MATRKSVRHDDDLMNGALLAGFDTSDQALLLVVEVTAPVNVNHFITNTIVTIKSIMVET